MSIIIVSNVAFFETGSQYTEQASFELTHYVTLNSSFLPQIFHSLASLPHPGQPPCLAYSSIFAIMRVHSPFSNHIAFKSRLYYTSPLLDSPQWLPITLVSPNFLPYPIEAYTM